MHLESCQIVNITYAWLKKLSIDWYTSRLCIHFTNEKASLHEALMLLPRAKQYCRRRPGDFPKVNKLSNK